MLPLALVLGTVWGVIWAMFIQLTTLGEYLAAARTWIVVVIGVGVDLLILLLVLNWQTVALVTAIIAASSLGIITRSVLNEYHQTEELINVNPDEIG